MEIGKTHFAQDWAIQGREQWQQESMEAKGIPKEYRCHHKVFSDQQAMRLPPSRPEDHTIKLIPGAPETINCKVYPLTLAEQKVTKSFWKRTSNWGTLKRQTHPGHCHGFSSKKRTGC
jgi:hypothetical protein